MSECVCFNIHSAMHSSDIRLVLTSSWVIWSLVGVKQCVCMMCVWARWLHRWLLSFRGDRGVRLSGSEQHVLVVYCPLAAPLRFQLIVWIPLRDDGSVGVGVAEQRSPPYWFTPTQRSRDWWRRVLGGVGASERVAPRLRDGAGSGRGAGGGAGGRGLAGAASQAAVS